VNIERRKMKRRNIYALAVLFMVTATTFFACQKDNQDEISTSTSDRDKFLGTWITQSSGSVHGTLNFTMNITAGNSSASQIKIENFDEEGAGTFVFGDVSGTTVSLTQTTIGGDVITRSGRYSNNGTLSFTYTVNDGQTIDNRTATAHK
jgi:hypothetical protein